MAERITSEAVSSDSRRKDAEIARIVAMHRWGWSLMPKRCRISDVVDRLMEEINDDTR